MKTKEDVQRFKDYFPSPIGMLELVADDEALREINYVETALTCQKNDILKAASEQLQLYFGGRLQIFELPLKPDGTAFQQIVWANLLKIPYGKTISYLELSRMIGNEKAIRAVGSANGKNPIPIIIPCHRVIGSNGALVGYSGGLWRKERLLAIEGHPTQIGLEF